MKIEGFKIQKIEGTVYAASRKHNGKWIHIPFFKNRRNTDIVKHINETWADVVNGKTTN